jgi:hypothetical protein
VAAVKEVRVTTRDRRRATVIIEYESGSTQLVVADQLKMPSPLDPAEAKLQVARTLNKLRVALPRIEPDQIVIVWT